MIIVDFMHALNKGLLRPRAESIQASHMLTYKLTCPLLSVKSALNPIKPATSAILASAVAPMIRQKAFENVRVVQS